MYVVTSTAFVSRTRATLRNAEFGFFGVCVYTRMHTPRFSGHPASAGDFVLVRIPSRPIRTNCANVGTVFPHFGLLDFFKSNVNPRSRAQFSTPLAWRADKSSERTHYAERCTANPERPARNSARTPRGRITLLA